MPGIPKQVNLYKSALSNSFNLTLLITDSVIVYILRCSRKYNLFWFVGIDEKNSRAYYFYLGCCDSRLVVLDTGGKWVEESVSVEDGYVKATTSNTGTFVLVVK